MFIEISGLQNRWFAKRKLKGMIIGKWFSPYEHNNTVQPQNKQQCVKDGLSIYQWFGFWCLEDDKDDDDLVNQVVNLGGKFTRVDQLSGKL